MRGWGTTHDTRILAQTIDPRFIEVRKDTLALAEREAGMAEALGCLKEHCEFVAKHAEAYAQFRQALESGKTYAAAERAALHAARQTMPVGGPAIGILEQVARG